MSCCGYVPSIDVYKPSNGKIIEVFKLNVEPKDAVTFIPWLLIIRYYNPTDMSGKEILITRDFTNILRYLDNWLVLCVIGLYADQSGDNQLKKKELRKA